MLVDISVGWSRHLSRIEGLSVIGRDHVPWPGSVIRPRRTRNVFGPPYCDSALAVEDVCWLTEVFLSEVRYAANSPHPFAWIGLMPPDVGRRRIVLNGKIRRG